MEKPPVDCSIEGCDKPARKRTWCQMHYARWRTHGDPLFDWTPERREHGLCSVDGCGLPERTGDLCNKHYERRRFRLKRGVDIPVEVEPIRSDPPRRPSSECEVPGCDRRTQSRGICKPHRRRLRRTGSPRPEQPIGAPKQDTLAKAVGRRQKARAERAIELAHTAIAAAVPPFTPAEPFSGSLAAFWGLTCPAGHVSRLWLPMLLDEYHGTAPTCHHCEQCRAERGRAEVVAFLALLDLTPVSAPPGVRPWVDRWSVICPAGHEQTVRPSTAAQKGRGCSRCVDKATDPAILYLVRYVDDDGTPFLKVGIGVRRLDRPGARRLDEHSAGGAQVLEVIPCSWWEARRAERLVLEAFRPGYAYRPRRPGAGPYLKGAETLVDSAPVNLSRIFPLA